MTTPTALLSTLLLAALAAAAASAKQLPAPNDVKTACSFATIPALCNTLIDKYAPASLRDLTAASIKETTEQTDKAKAAASAAEAQPGTDKTVKAGLSTCTQELGQALDALHKADGNLDTKDDYSDVVAEVKAAVTYIGACNDAFSENPGVVSPVADATSILKKLVGNSLSLSMALQVQSEGGVQAEGGVHAGN